MSPTSPGVPADAPAAAEVTAASALGRLGALMLDAGYAVTDVSHVLHAAARRRDEAGTRVGVLPTAVFVETPTSPGAHLVEATGNVLTFDQVGRVGRLVASAELALVGWGGLVAQVDSIRAQPNLHPMAVRVAGSGLMSAGIAVVFGAHSWSILTDGLLGLIVGAAIILLSRIVRIAQLMPFVTALGVTLVLCGLSAWLGLGPVPLFAVCAPLVVLIPGATVTNAVLELSGGDAVSGGGRFISGLVTWALLAAGVVAGMSMIGGHVVGSAIVEAGVSTASSGWGPPVPDWLVWPATAAVGLGVGMFFSASRRLSAVIVATMLLTYGVFAVSQSWLGPAVAAGVTAGIVLVGTRVLETRRPRYPCVVVFRPAYWLLVPGSFGLVAVTSAGDTAGGFIATTVGTVIALIVGTQVGALLVEAGESLVRRRRRSGEAAEAAQRGR